MLKGISWSQYIQFIGSALVLYYIVLLAMNRNTVAANFRKKFEALQNKTKRTWRPQDAAATKQPEIGNEQLPENENDEKESLDETSNAHSSDINGDKDRYYPLVHDLVDEIEAFLEASGKDVEKQTIIESLGRLVRKYAILSGTSFKEGIDNLIAASCENNCSIQLSRDEIRGLWI